MTQMTPEEDYRRLMSALNEHSTFEEQQQQQQRLYQLAGGISVPSHSGEDGEFWELKSAHLGECNKDGWGGRGGG